MSPYLKVLLLGCGAVLAFDALASLASVAFGFPYVYAGVGSFLIYLLVGAAAVRYVSVRRSALTGALVGLVDATLGWAISWQIGAAGVRVVPLAPARMVWTAILVSMLAAAVSGVGAALSSRRGGQSNAAA